jgi:ubiquinone/menaquinone biosynthesis C-methylase UbiE
MSVNAWLGIGFACAVVVILLYWLLITTEGAFLGRRVVIWLYDITAHKYDGIKQYDPRDERLLVTRPILNATTAILEPAILDVATGTGRVPFDLFQDPAFTGTVTGLDDSNRMLQHAREKLAPFCNRVRLVHHAAVPLPFHDASFDLVSCLEALEFFPSDKAALAEMVRVLRPGCFLLVTRRRGGEAKLFLNRYRSRAALRAQLSSLGLEEIHFHAWQLNYDLVTARKPA